MENEIWRPLVYRGEDFGDTYEVSNYGKIRNKITGKNRKLSLNKQGYYYCVISRGRKRKLFIKVHRAVAENFVNGDKNLAINHKDCNKTNNYFENLEFCTIAENNKHAREHGLVKYQIGSECHNAKLKDEEVRKIRDMYKTGMYTQKEIADMFNIKPDSVCLIVHNKIYVNS